MAKYVRAIPIDTRAGEMECVNQHAQQLEWCRCFDYIIVAPAPPVASWQSTIATTHQVLVLEPARRPLDLAALPIGYRYTIETPRYALVLPRPGRAGPQGPLDQPSARQVIGGSSAINGMFQTRRAAADFDRLAPARPRRWGWDDVLPHFKAHETSSSARARATAWAGSCASSDARALAVLMSCSAPRAEDGLTLLDDSTPATTRASAPSISRRNAAPLERGNRLPQACLRRSNLKLETEAMAERLLLGAGAPSASNIAKGLSDGRRWPRAR